MTRGLTTVICPTYNRSAAILPTIESVRRQTVTDWELLVVSDGCTDDTEDRVNHAARADPRIRLFRVDHSGHPAGPRNHALARARGSVVAYIDHDDTWYPEHLERTLAALEATGAALAAGGNEYRDESGRLVSRLPPLGAHWHPDLQLVGPMFEPSRVVHRRGIVEQVGGWRAGIGLEDWDLWLRLADAGITVATLAGPTAVLRYDPGSRRHRMARRHRLAIAHFDNAALARQVMQQLRASRHAGDFRAACAADMAEWFARMASTPRFSAPLDWAGDVGEAIRAEAGAVDGLFDDLVLVPDRGGGVVLGKILTCATVEHARRIEALLPSVQRRQLALIRRVVQEVVANRTRVHVGGPA